MARFDGAFAVIGRADRGDPFARRFADADLDEGTANVERGAGERERIHGAVRVRAPARLDAPVGLDVGEVLTRNATHRGEVAADVEAARSVPFDCVDRRRAAPDPRQAKVAAAGIDANRRSGRGPHLGELAADVGRRARRDHRVDRAVRDVDPGIGGRAPCPRWCGRQKRPG